MNHDQSETNYRTFDLSTGDEINMKSWQSWIEYKYLSEWGVGEKLNKLILSKFPKEETDPNHNDCISMYDQETQYKVRVDKDGIAFYAESPLGNCDIEFIVTFQELEPFLSDEGKKIKKLLSDHKDTGKNRYYRKIVFKVNEMFMIPFLLYMY